MRFAITGTDARFLPLRKLLLADGHEITDPASADMVISPPWDPSARYARREEYQIAIARLTAEGAIALLRPETGLSGAHILLLGYGRIARLLARELQKAGALVTAAARSGEQRAWAEAEGIEALPLDALSGALDRFDVIIGTIPAPVLTEPLLALVRKDALLLELASAPGGLWLAIILVLGITYCGLYSDRVILTILIGFCYAILIIMLCINTRKHIDCCREQAAKQNGNGESPQ